MTDLRAPKHLVLNGFPLQDSHRGRGVGRYTDQLYANILARWERDDPVLTNAFAQISLVGAASPDLRELFENKFSKTTYVPLSQTVEKRNLLKYFYYKFLTSPRLNEYFAKSEYPTVYFLPRHQILSSPIADYTVTMVHDFAPLITKRWGKVPFFDPVLRYEYSLYLNELKKADLIITNSTDTTNAVSHYLGRKHDISTVLLGNVFEHLNVDHYESSPSPVQEPYFLYYGGFDYNKNIPGLIKAFAIFIRSHEDTNHTKLLFSGGTKVAPMLIELAKKEGILENILLMDNISDAELPLYITHALGLFRFSFVEGCGLVEIEVMSMGVPVISANIGAIREMVGEFAFLSDPRRPEEAAPYLYQAAKHRIDLERLLRGKAHAREFTWSKTADETISAITEYTRTHKSIRDPS